MGVENTETMVPISNECREIMVGFWMYVEGRANGKDVSIRDIKEICTILF